MVSFFSRIYSNMSTNKYIRFTKFKALIGLFLGFSAYFICSHYYHARRMGALFALMFILLGLFKFDFQELFPKKHSYIRTLFPLISLIIICTISLNLVTNNCTMTMGVANLLLNILISLALYFLLAFITGNFTAALFLSAFVLMSISTANGFVYLFRQKELCATDIFSARTALNVINQYTFFLPMDATFRWLWVTLIVFAQFCLEKKKFKKSVTRISCLLVALLCAATVFFSSKDKNAIMSWATNGSEQNGFFLNFYLSFRDSFVQVPQNYSSQNIDALSEAYSDYKASSKSPNIIVIMNETFADLDIFKNPLNSSEPIIPFVSSLEDNTIRGNALVSVFGGSTANSEFEFLTGHTMLFFPNSTDVIPYQQYIPDKIYVLSELANVLGYDTFATHPYDSRGWSRERLYPLFGFGKITFLDDYPQQDLIRSLVSDREMYDYILDQLNCHSADKPLFLFGVTMQNHGGYGPRDDYKHNMKLTGYGQTFPEAEQYLSLIKESDKAVEYLLGELEDYPEDTVVLFFGDHMPMIEDELYTVLNGGTPDSLDEQMLKYTVPFFIWANYDIEEYTLEKTSLNYLAGHLLEAAGIELPPYYQFLRDTEEIIPAINAFGYYSKSRGCMIPLEEAEGEEAEALRRYEHVQYNNMFDAENRNQLFFGQYIN